MANFIDIMKQLVTLILLFLSTQVSFSQNYFYGRFDYIQRFDQPEYAYFNESGIFENSAVPTIKPAVAFSEGSVNILNNDVTLGQEAGLSMLRTDYTVSSATFEHFYFLIEGRFLIGKSFHNDLINLHAGPLVSIKLNEGGFKGMNHSTSNRWLWLGSAVGVQFHLAHIFIVARYNHYFTNVNADYRRKKNDLEHVHINTNVSYFSIGLGLDLSKR